MTDEIRVQNIPSLLQAIDAVYSAFKNQPWWRGHGESDWRLVPHVLRITDRGTSYEANIAMKFVRLAPTRHPDVPGADDVASWLVLMQHNRLPTRFLDWTESPLVALYFAVANQARDGENGAIWALDPFLMNELRGEKGVLRPKHAQVMRLIDLAFTKAAPEDEAVFALASDEIDIRMLVQLSGMTIHGSREPLEARQGHERFLRKFVVDKGVKAELRTELKKLGIRERHLFPDLEHLSADLKRDMYPD